jgi:hypothetical protein
MLDLGSGLTYLKNFLDLDFLEFENLLLINLFIKAQIFKSVASTIPPRPRTYIYTIIIHNILNNSSGGDTQI